PRLRGVSAFFLRAATESPQPGRTLCTMKIVLLAALAVLSSCSSSRADVRDELRAGDLVFHRSTSAQSAVIAEVTRSELTHVGIVLPHEGELAVLEAVGPVKWTPLDAWIARGEGLVVRRAIEPLSEADVAALVREGERLLGRPYDARFEWGDN